MLKFQIIALAITASLFFAVVGFGATDQNLKKVQDELAATKAVLADTQKERDALKAEVAKLKKQQPGVSIVRERDDAIQAAAGFQADYANALDLLQDQAYKNLILQEQVFDQQQKIKYLLHRLDGATVMPSPGLTDNTVVMPSPTF